MGNLLGAPVTEKETHKGKTSTGEEYGLSSMQGWRVHMEDAHIAECNLYAVVEAKAEDGGSKVPSKTIELPGHSLFAVFDGHGGTFSAQYSGDNFCRILSRQPTFVQYAEFCQERLTRNFADAADRVQFMRHGMDHLEAALKQAFVELDYEIAMAVRGLPHPLANQHYHEEEQGDEDAPMTDTAPAPTSAMEAAHQAAVNTSKALDDEGDSGTTACCVIITPDWLVCANAGDSRAVASKNSSKAVPLSYDHKPEDEAEERRIRSAGGYVAGGRVEGDLAVSRGLGDFRFKHMPTVLSVMNEEGDDEAKNADPPIVTPGDQKVSPVPDIVSQNRNSEHDEFIVVACDGIWDVRSNQACVEDVAAMFQEGESDIGLISEELLDQCLHLGSKDNMTAIVVKFPAQTVGDGGGVTARRKEREENEQDGEENEGYGEGEPSYS